MDIKKLAEKYDDYIIEQRRYFHLKKKKLLKP